MIFWSFFCTTVMILCDEAANLLGGRSLLVEIVESRGAFLKFVATGAVSGILLDGAAQWIGKLWVYPYWNTGLYAGTFVLGFCAYWLLLAETYVVTRLLLARARPLKRGAPPARASAIFRAAGLAGAALTAWGIMLAVTAYRTAGDYMFDIRTPSRAVAPFACFPLISSGVWLVLEWAQYRLGRTSLLAGLLRGNWRPPAAMIAASWTFGFFMESVNTAHHFWRYTNWPFGNRRVFGIPALVLLLWPLQYLIFVSVHQVMSEKPLIVD